MSGRIVEERRRSDRRRSHHRISLELNKRSTGNLGNPVASVTDEREIRFMMRATMWMMILTSAPLLVYNALYYLCPELFSEPFRGE